MRSVRPCPVSSPAVPPPSPAQGRGRVSTRPPFFRPRGGRRWIRARRRRGRRRAYTECPTPRGGHASGALFRRAIADPPRRRRRVSRRPRRRPRRGPRPLARRGGEKSEEKSVGGEPPPPPWCWPPRGGAEPGGGGGGPPPQNGPG